MYSLSLGLDICRKPISTADGATAALQPIPYDGGLTHWTRPTGRHRPTLTHSDESIAFRRFTFEFQMMAYHSSLLFFSRSICSKITVPRNSGAPFSGQHFIFHVHFLRKKVFWSAMKSFLFEKLYQWLHAVTIWRRQMFRRKRSRRQTIHSKVIHWTSTTGARLIIFPRPKQAIFAHRSRLCPTKS